MRDIKTVIGHRMLKLRKRLNLSQIEMARELDIPQPSLSSYEKGKVTLPLETAIKIADKSKVSLDWLCGRDDHDGINDLSQIVSFLYALAEANEINCIFNVTEPDSGGKDDNGEVTGNSNQWTATLTFNGNDKDHRYNADLCMAIKSVMDNTTAMDNSMVTTEFYKYQKGEDIRVFSGPLTYEISQLRTIRDAADKRIAEIMERKRLLWEMDEEEE